MGRIFLFSVAIFVAFQIYAQDNLQEPQDWKNLSLTEIEERADLFYNQGDYRTSLRLNIHLLEKAFQEKDDAFIYRGYRNLGYDYLKLNDTAYAQQNFEKARDYVSRLKSEKATALSYMDLANIAAEIDTNYTKALEYHEKSIALFEKLKDSSGLADAHYNTILTALEMEDFKTAYTHILKARKYTKHKEHLYNNIGLDILTGEYYLEKDNFELAEKYLSNALKNAEAENLTDELEWAYLTLSKTYAAAGQPEKAYQTRVKYDEYLEKNLRKISNAKNEILSAEFQLAEYKKGIEAAELRNQLQQEVVQNKSRLNTILIIVSICFLIAVIALFLAFFKRRKLIRKLRYRNREYLAAKKESERLANLKSQFFSTVSHELRTPLYGVIGLSSLLLDDKTLDEKHRDDLKSLKFSADYLMALINDVLQLNKIDAQPKNEHHSTFNLSILISSIISSFEYMLKQNSNEIEVSIEKSIPENLKGNSVALSQVLMNLIGNACKFTEHGKIKISIVEKERIDNLITLRFVVEDNGIGIAKEQQKAIFDEFSQVDATNKKYHGTGLGLTIVKKILSKENSQIHLESEVGKGAVFYFEMTYTATRSKNNIPAKTLEETNLKGKRILVAEDNQINQVVTEKILNKENISCDIANNGEEAVRFVKENYYDLVLMDINMPIKNGIEATREIRSFNPNIPIIALTAVEPEEMKNEILSCGMNDIVIKPYDLNQFLAVITLHIKQKKTEAALMGKL